MKRKNPNIKRFKENIDEAIKKGRVEFTMASVDKVESLQDDIDTILEALDSSEALVTDESELMDFFCTFYEPEEVEKELDDLRDTLGVDIEDEFEKVVDIAARLMYKRIGKGLEKDETQE